MLTFQSFPKRKARALKPRSGSQSSKLVPRGQYPPPHTHPHKSRADPSPLRNVPPRLPPPQGAPEEEPGHRRRRGVLATLPTCCSRPAQEQPRSARATEQTNERAPGCFPRPARAPSSRLPGSSLASSRRLQQAPDRTAAALRAALAPLMHLSPRPPHLRRRRKVPASRRTLAPRVRSGRTRSSSRPGPAPRTPPRPGSSSAEGVRGRGRSSPRLPHPPAPLSPPRSPLPPPAPLSAASRPARPFASGPPHPPEPRLLPRPPVALPLNFPPRWRPWSWPGARPRDCFPDALSQ